LGVNSLTALPKQLTTFELRTYIRAKWSIALKKRLGKKKISAI